MNENEEDIDMVNKISLNGTSYHGLGAIGEITAEVKSRGFKKAFVASDPDLVKFGVTAKVTSLLDKEGMTYEIYSDIKPNPTISNVQKASRLSRSRVLITSSPLAEVLPWILPKPSASLSPTLNSKTSEVWKA